MSGLAPIADRVRAIVPMLGSSHDGEVVAAARALAKVLRDQGLDLHDLAAVALKGAEAGFVPQLASSPTQHIGWRAAALYCARNADRLRSKEADFVRSLADRPVATGWAPSERQRSWLTSIYSRLWEPEHA